MTWELAVLGLTIWSHLVYRQFSLLPVKTWKNVVNVYMVLGLLLELNFCYPLFSFLSLILNSYCRVTGANHFKMICRVGHLNLPLGWKLSFHLQVHKKSHLNRMFLLILCSDFCIFWLLWEATQHIYLKLQKKMWIRKI